MAIDIKPTLVLNRLNLMDSANESLQKGKFYFETARRSIKFYASCGAIAQRNHFVF